MTDRIVLAYSGGLDTSVSIGWLAYLHNLRGASETSPSAGLRRSGHKDPLQPITGAEQRGRHQVVPFPGPAATSRKRSVNTVDIPDQRTFDQEAL